MLFFPAVGESTGLNGGRASRLSLEDLCMYWSAGRAEEFWKRSILATIGVHKFATRRERYFSASAKQLVTGASELNGQIELANCRYRDG